MRRARQAQKAAKQKALPLNDDTISLLVRVVFSFSLLPSPPFTWSLLVFCGMTLTVPIDMGTNLGKLKKKLLFFKGVRTSSTPL